MSERTRKHRAGVPEASSESALHRMQAAKPRDTKPEQELRAELDALGIPYIVDVRIIPSVRRRADIVFKSRRVAIFVDGCFWHGCPIHGTWPKQNAEFWRNKIETNQRRDVDTNEKLAAFGWSVIRVWEHEDPHEAGQRIASILESRTSGEDDESM